MQETKNAMHADVYHHIIYNIIIYIYISYYIQIFRSHEQSNSQITWEDLRQGTYLKDGQEFIVHRWFPTLDCQKYHQDQATDASNAEGCVKSYGSRHFQENLSSFGDFQPWTVFAKQPLQGCQQDGQPSVNAVLFKKGMDIV